MSQDETAPLLAAAFDTTVAALDATTRGAFGLAETAIENTPGVVWGACAGVGAMVSAAHDAVAVDYTPEPMMVQGQEMEPMAIESVDPMQALLVQHGMDQALGACGVAGDGASVSDKEALEAAAGLSNMAVAQESSLQLA